MCTHSAAGAVGGKAAAQTHIHTRARARKNRGINYGARHVMKNGFFADKQVQRATTKSATT